MRSPLAMKLATLVLAGALLLEGLPASASPNTGVMFPEGVSPGGKKGPCPVACSDAGPDPRKWKKIRKLGSLSVCDEDLLLDFQISTSLRDDEDDTIFRVCSATSSAEKSPKDDEGPVELATRQDDGSQNAEDSSQDTRRCGASTMEEVSTTASISKNPGMRNSSSSSAAKHLQEYLTEGARCGSIIIFSKVQDMTVGLYAAPDIDRDSVATLVEKYLILEKDVSIVQVCDSKAGAFNFGLYATPLDHLADTQDAMASWIRGECLDVSGEEPTLEDVDITVLTSSIKPSSDAFSSNGTLPGTKQNEAATSPSLRLRPRADCKAIQVKPENGCAVLAERCGISKDKLTDFNSGDNFCGNLIPDQWICCSKGTLPYRGPKPNDDGTCFTHQVANGETCDSLARANSLKIDQIEKFNEKSWGWNTCDKMLPDQIICLSPGDPPMPFQDPENPVDCGPAKEGTKRPDNWDDISGLNQCPLRACCSKHGFCGLTDEFCKKKKSLTGAPGTAGCISNCGMEITNNDEGPENFIKVAYFEAWNKERPCLNMDVTQIDTEVFTHVHFAFPDITEDYRVDMSKIQSQFDKFEELDGVHKVVSFGGWGYSTSPETFHIFRLGVNKKNRQVFADNMVQFLKDHDIDGLDFDWEYPGEPDIDGIPSGSIEDGGNYLEFLKLVREQLPEGKTLSVALPASYWYLKQFPVEKMGPVLDYVIYMTYDLHGQWDAGNEFTTPGCESGNCLRSHVNKTETESALALITKAGMPSKKVVCGVSSYGRSFRMADPSCTGPNCFFTGDRLNSNSFPGPCTNTSGYLADAEIMGIFTDYEALPGDDSGVDEFVSKNTGLESMGGYTGYEWYDQPSDSDILIYTDGQSWDWLAYMDAETKGRREEWYRGLNFAGTSDWAVDLGMYYEEELDGGILDDVEDLRCRPDKFRPGSFEELEENLDKMPEKCRIIYGIELLQDQLDGAVDSYEDAKDGFDDLFGWYEDYVKDNVGPMLLEFMDIKDGPGNKFFTCKWTQPGGGGTTEKCPPHTDFSETKSYTIEYTLDDEDGFYRALEEELGVAKDWIKFGDKEYPYCDPAWTNDTPGTTVQPCREIERNHVGIPVKADDMEVPNPKELVETAMPNITKLAGMNEASLVEVALSMYDGEDGDVLTGASLPVFMLEGAAESMEKIKEIGAELKKAHERDLILMIVGIVLMAIPFVGEVGALVTGSANVARFAVLAAEAGGVGMTVEEIIHDPDSAPLAIAGLLLGAGTGGRVRPRSERFKDAGDAARALDSGSLKVLPKRLRDRHDSVQRIDKYCRL